MLHDIKSKKYSHEEAGIVTLVNGENQAIVSFDIEFSSVDYIPSVNILNDVDLNPCTFGILIKRETTQMTVRLSGTIDSDNYKLSWRAVI
jgi:methionine-rich copper-binding protein CopC